MADDVGPIILRLPGMTLNGTIFPRMSTRFIDVDFNTMVVSGNGDLPGLGGMETHVRALDRRLRAEPVWRRRPRVVVGHSFGGMLALSWLLAHRCAGPARIDGLVLVSTTAGPMFNDVRFRVLGVGRHELRIGLGTFIEFWNRPLVTRVVKRITCGRTLEAEAIDFRQLDTNSDLAVDLAGWRTTDWRAMRSYRHAMRGFDVRKRLADIDIPTVVLHGSRDLLLPVAAGRRLAGGLPRAQFRVVPGAGHMLPLTHGNDLVGAVDAVLEGALRPAKDLEGHAEASEAPHRHDGDTGTDCQ